MSRWNEWVAWICLSIFSAVFGAFLVASLGPATLDDLQIALIGGVFTGIGLLLAAVITFSAAKMTIEKANYQNLILAANMVEQRIRSMVAIAERVQTAYRATQRLLTLHMPSEGNDNVSASEFEQRLSIALQEIQIGIEAKREFEFIGHPSEDFTALYYKYCSDIDRSTNDLLKIQLAYLTSTSGDQSDLRKTISYSHFYFEFKDTFDQSDQYRNFAELYDTISRLNPLLLEYIEVLRGTLAHLDWGAPIRYPF